MFDAWFRISAPPLGAGSPGGDAVTRFEPQRRLTCAFDPAGARPSLVLPREGTRDAPDRSDASQSARVETRRPGLWHSHVATAQARRCRPWGQPASRSGRAAGGASGRGSRRPGVVRDALVAETSYPEFGITAFMFRPNLGVNDVNEHRSEPSSRAVMFTLSTTSTTSAWVRIRPPESTPARPRRPRSARRLHVNDSDRPWWRRFCARREHNRNYPDFPVIPTRASFLRVSPAQRESPGAAVGIIGTVCTRRRAVCPACSEPPDERRRGRAEDTARRGKRRLIRSRADQRSPRPRDPSIVACRRITPAEVGARDCNGGNYPDQITSPMPKCRQNAHRFTPSRDNRKVGIKARPAPRRAVPVRYPCSVTAWPGAACRLSGGRHRACAGECTSGEPGASSQPCPAACTRKRRSERLWCLLAARGRNRSPASGPTSEEFRPGACWNAVVRLAQRGIGSLDGLL
jgi:hypothetical protein